MADLTPLGKDEVQQLQVMGKDEVNSLPSPAQQPAAKPYVPPQIGSKVEFPADDQANIGNLVQAAQDELDKAPAHLWARHVFLGDDSQLPANKALQDAIARNPKQDFTNLLRGVIRGGSLGTDKVLDPSTAALRDQAVQTGPGRFGELLGGIGAYTAAPEIPLAQGAMGFIQGFHQDPSAPVWDRVKSGLKAGALNAAISGGAKNIAEQAGQVTRDILAPTAEAGAQHAAAASVSGSPKEYQNVIRQQGGARPFGKDILDQGLTRNASGGPISSIYDVQRNAEAAANKTGQELSGHLKNLDQNILGNRMDVSNSDDAYRVGAGVPEGTLASGESISPYGYKQNGISPFDVLFGKEPISSGIHPPEGNTLDYQPGGINHQAPTLEQLRQDLPRPSELRQRVEGTLDRKNPDLEGPANRIRKHLDVMDAEGSVPRTPQVAGVTSTTNPDVNTFEELHGLRRRLDDSIDHTQDDTTQSADNKMRKNVRGVVSGYLNEKAEAAAGKYLPEGAHQDFTEANRLYGSMANARDMADSTLKEMRSSSVMHPVEWLQNAGKSYVAPTSANALRATAQKLSLVDPLKWGRLGSYLAASANPEVDHFVLSQTNPDYAEAFRKAQEQSDGSGSSPTPTR